MKTDDAGGPCLHAKAEYVTAVHLMFPPLSLQSLAPPVLLLPDARIRRQNEKMTQLQGKDNLHRLVDLEPEIWWWGKAWGSGSI